MTFLTKPEPDEVLVRFYRRVRPDVRGWRRIAAQAGDSQPHQRYRRESDCVGAGLMIYMCLFGTGKLLLHQPMAGTLLLAGSAVGCALLLYRLVVRNFRIEPDPTAVLPYSYRG